MSQSTRAGQFTTEMKFKNHLESIKATLYDYTPMDRLIKYIPEFVSMTWLEDVRQMDKYMASKDMSRADFVDETFSRHTLPTALETIRLTFMLEGLDLTNVTHVIRHRMFSFSAQSSDPTSMEGHDILENDAFYEHPKLRARAQKLCIEANELYKDALDAGMTYYDARHYQPRAKEAKYFMSGNIKDFIDFVNTRLGRCNQPTSDNILAARIRSEILKVYPQVKIWMPAEKVQMAYVSCINQRCNLNTYPPDTLHRNYLVQHGINFSGATFNHPKARDMYTCNNHYEKLFNSIIEESDRGSSIPF